LASVESYEVPLALIPPNLPYDGRPVLARIRFPVVTDPAGCTDPDGLGDGGVTEPGCWNPTDAEAKALRTYMQKGGFLLLDDLTFSDGTYQHLELAIARVEAWLKRVLPDDNLIPVPASDPLFEGFFKITPTMFRHRPRRRSSTGRSMASTATTTSPSR
jgi:hypothetical protein